MGGKKEEKMMTFILIAIVILYFVNIILCIGILNTRARIANHEARLRSDIYEAVARVHQIYEDDIDHQALKATYKNRGDNY